MTSALIKAVVLIAILAAAIAAPLVVRHRAGTGQRVKDAALQQGAAELARLAAENERLSNIVAQAARSAPSPEQLGETLRLRSEIGRLRQAVTEADRLRLANRQLAAGTNAATGRAASPPDPATVQAVWPKDQLAFAGYADPASALQTALTAMSRGDPDLLAASVTPEAKSELTREKWNEHGSAADEMATAARSIAGSLKSSGAFYLVGQRTAAPDLAIMEVYFDGDGRTRKFALRKLGGEWKFSVMARADETDESGLQYGYGAWP